MAVDIKLGEVNTFLRLRIKQLREIEKLTGIPLDKAEEKGGVDFTMTAIYCALKTANPTITQEKTEDLIEAHIKGGGSMEYIAEKLEAAMIESGLVNAVKAEKSEKESPNQ